MHQNQPPCKPCDSPVRNHIPAPAGSQSHTTNQPDQLIRQPLVSELTGLGRSTIYALPDFPKKIQIGRRAVGWKRSEVLAWLESRVNA
ncbi:AlpA family phage regulatory protein [Rhodoferax sp. U2-2l]|uniref:helix-turn-helix transcriptional regulator n=1 Tax=Rhodoferax sp. U2-2l TaxID=2884000 RepID=UPI001D0BC94A|nr:AlpA family phage regulatory protein [Rhodoferax sp. U2-2l]MCB8747707.1 AlpA family phage regulatory protein [Rhodoferax sp. U2-2l]